MKNNLRDTIEEILIDSTKGISTYEPSMVNIIINKDQATEAILKAVRDVVEGNEIITLTGTPDFKFDDSPETFKRLWNAHINNLLKELGGGE